MPMTRMEFDDACSTILRPRWKTISEWEYNRLYEKITNVDCAYLREAAGIMVFEREAHRRPSMGALIALTHECERKAHLRGASDENEPYKPPRDDVVNLAGRFERAMVKLGRAPDDYAKRVEYTRAYIEKLNTMGSPLDVDTLVFLGDQIRYWEGCAA